MFMAFINQNIFEIKMGNKLVSRNPPKGAIRLQYKYVLCKEMNQRLGGSTIDWHTAKGKLSRLWASAPDNFAHSLVVFCMTYEWTCLMKYQAMFID